MHYLASNLLAFESTHMYVCNLLVAETSQGRFKDTHTHTNFRRKFSL